MAASDEPILLGEIVAAHGIRGLVKIRAFTEDPEQLFAYGPLRDENGRRPIMGDHTKLQHDPHFRDLVLFYEHFHGDDGRGVGASHQTGWTGLVAKLIQPAGSLYRC